MLASLVDCLDVEHLEGLVSLTGAHQFRFVVNLGLETKLLTFLIIKLASSVGDLGTVDLCSVATGVSGEALALVQA